MVTKWLFERTQLNLNYPVMVLMGLTHHSDSGTLKGGYESDGIIDLVKNTKEMYIPLL